MYTSARSFKKALGLATWSLCLVSLSQYGVAITEEPAKLSERELQAQLAERVTLYRDPFGVPHIDARDLPAAVFAFGYAQCEDYFWQVEDSIVWSLGRYAEIYGKSEIQTDLVTHSFEIPTTSERDYARMVGENATIAEAFTAGINLYLQTHPEVKPRLITHFEPWHLLALSRRLYLELAFQANHVGGQFVRLQNNEVYQQSGSNAWAIGPSKTKSGSAMLFINPHQPWYGFGQWYEGHVRTDDGIDFYGATFFGSPLPAIGHNHKCGWSFTVNEPDVVDLWNVRFETDNPNTYRHGDQVKQVTQWQHELRVKGQAEPQVLTMRKTHHGPVMKANSDGSYQVCQVANLYEQDILTQIKALLRSETVYDVKEAMGMHGLPIFNTVAADYQGNILYLYSGSVPRRDPSFDWTKPVDGNDPRTDWRGLHSIDEMPLVVNPPSGYVQSCNSTPYTTTDDGNPQRLDFPPYMVTDQYDDKRRAQVSRHILRSASDVTLEQFEELAFDTRIYWALNELPRFKSQFERLKDRNPELADRARQYFEHFEGWDCRITEECTRSPLCVAWYEELYGFGYPAETLKKEYIENPDLKFEALVKAADKLKSNFKNWQVRWGDVFRIQRHHNVANLIAVPFSDRKPSISCVGAPGPLGIVFTVYYTPSMYIPIVRETRNQYALVGTSYTGVVEFAPDGVKSKSLINFGSSSDPNSPHYFDQAQLMSRGQMKETLFDWDEIREKAQRSYRPGTQQK